MISLSRGNKKQGQSVLEYSLIVSVVIAALVTMNLYVQRSVKANLKMIENQINDEINAGTGGTGGTGGEPPPPPI